jgi:hypothetical protein
MSTELLIQLLIGISIVAIGFMIAIFWRVFGILSDVKETTVIVKKRVQDVDAGIGKFEKTLTEGMDALKGFVYSLEFIKSIREKIESYKKGEK